MRRASDGSILLMSKHPVGSNTWHWSISVTREPIVEWRGRLWTRSTRRCHQWHDFYRLPFGWTLIWSAQDYHRRRPA